jgi:hypothetical protein
MNKLSVPSQSKRNSLALVLLILFMSGCSQQTGNSNVANPNVQPASSRVQAFDWGLAKPNQVLDHSFHFTNYSLQTWHVKKIYKECSCITSTLSKSTVAAGEEAVLTISVKAGELDTNVSRNVIVFFQEPDVRPIKFVLRATVRNQISFSPTSIELGTVSRAGKRQFHLEVQNYSDKNWDTISLQQIPDWISARIEPVMVVGLDEQKPRQIWRVLFALDCSMLSSGAHKEALTFSAGKESAKILLSVYIEEPVIAIPSQILLLKDAKDKGEMAVITIAFGTGIELPDPSVTRFVCNPEHYAEFHWKKVNGRRWELEARRILEQSTSPNSKPCELIIDFGSQTLLPLKIPVLVAQ